MNLKSKLISGAIGSVLIFAGGAYWLQSYVAHRVSDALIAKEIKDTAAANAKLEQVNKDLAGEIARIKQEGQSNTAELQSEKAKPATDAQIADLRRKFEELSQRAGVKASDPAPPPDKDGNVTWTRLAWRDHQISDNQCMNGLGTCEAVQAKQAEQIANLTEQRDGFKRNLDDLAKIKSPYIPPRNNLLFGATSGHGGIVLVTHRLKWFGDRLSIGAGAQASGLRDSRLFVVVGIPLGK